MYRAAHLVFFSVFMLPLALFGIGCASDDDGTIVRDTARVGDTRIGFPGEAAVDENASRNRSDGTSRGADDRPAPAWKNEIPNDAVQLQNWRENELSYEAEQPGFIYIFDETDNRIVYSGHVHRGERFSLDRQRSRATINGVVVYSQDRDEARNFKVYFDRD